MVKACNARGAMERVLAERLGVPDAREARLVDEGDGQMKLRYYTEVGYTLKEIKNILSYILFVGIVVGTLFGLIVLSAYLFPQG